MAVYATVKRVSPGTLMTAVGTPQRRGCAGSRRNGATPSGCPSSSLQLAHTSVAARQDQPFFGGLHGCSVELPRAYQHIDLRPWAQGFVLSAIVSDHPIGLPEPLVYIGLMDIDAAQTAGAIMPYVTAAVIAYGKDTADKIRDAVVDRASDASVNLGARLLRRILHQNPARTSIRDAMVDLSSGEPDSQAALRLQIRKALTADGELLREVIAMLNDDPERSPIAVGRNDGIVSVGDGVMNVRAQHNNGLGTFIGRDYHQEIGDPDHRR